MQKLKTLMGEKDVDRKALPRWVWAAATMGTVLIIAWFISMPVLKGPGCE